MECGVVVRLRQLAQDGKAIFTVMNRLRKPSPVRRQSTDASHSPLSSRLYSVAKLDA